MSAKCIAQRIKMKSISSYAVRNSIQIYLQIYGGNSAINVLKIQTIRNIVTYRFLPTFPCHTLQEYVVASQTQMMDQQQALCLLFSGTLSST